MLPHDSGLADLDASLDRASSSSSGTRSLTLLCSGTAQIGQEPPSCCQGYKLLAFIVTEVSISKILCKDSFWFSFTMSRSSGSCICRVLGEHDIVPISTSKSATCLLKFLYVATQTLLQPTSASSRRGHDHVITASARSSRHFCSSRSAELHPP